jgi:hypothetical protein
VTRDSVAATGVIKFRGGPEPGPSQV